MFVHSLDIINDKTKFYSSILNIDVDKVKKIKKIVHDIKTVTVFGFNSARFYSNLFKEFVNYKDDSFEWSIDNNSLIGTATSLKQFIIHSTTTKSLLRFIDAQLFIVIQLKKYC